MITMYDYVYAKKKITKQSVWWIIKAGDSYESYKALQFLNNLVSSSTDHYFKQHSLEVCEFKDNVARSLWPEVPYPTLLLPAGCLSIVDLARIIRKGQFSKLEIPNIQKTKEDYILSGAYSEADFINQRINCQSANEKKPK